LLVGSFFDYFVVVIGRGSRIEAVLRNRRIRSSSNWRPPSGRGIRSELIDGGNHTGVLVQGMVARESV